MRTFTISAVCLVAVLALAVVSRADAILINPKAFVRFPENQTFATPQFQSYGNITRDACAMSQIASKASPDYADAADIYLKGRFSFRVVNGSISNNRTRIFSAFAARSFDTEDWFKVWAQYYTKNASAPFYDKWINASLIGAAPYKAPHIRAASLKGLVAIYPVFYMFHEVHAGLNGLRTNDTRGSATEVTDGFFAFYGPADATCSAPVMFNTIGAKYCTLTKGKKSGRSIHLRSLERAFVIMTKATQKGNSTAGLSGFEAGRDLMIRSTTYSILQLVLDSAAAAAKAKTLTNYQSALALGRHYFLAAEPYVYGKSKAAARRLITIFNYRSSKIRKNIVGEVKAAIKLYTAAVGAKYEQVINAC